MKAILIVDMPSDGCKSCMFDTYGICLVRANEKDVKKRANRNWCPLKPMPNKRVPDGSETDQIYGCYVGWNACIDEILGETE